MSVHNININPYQIHSSGPRNFVKVMEQSMESLWKHSKQPIYQPPRLLPDGDCICKEEFNKLVGQLCPPVFLKQSLNTMMKLRDRKSIRKLLNAPTSEEASELEGGWIRNRMSFYQVPQVKKLVFDHE